MLCAPLAKVAVPSLSLLIRNWAGSASVWVVAPGQLTVTVAPGDAGFGVACASAGVAEVKMAPAAMMAARATSATACRPSPFFKIALLNAFLLVRGVHTFWIRACRGMRWGWCVCSCLPPLPGWSGRSARRLRPPPAPRRARPGKKRAAEPPWFASHAMGNKRRVTTRSVTFFVPFYRRFTFPPARPRSGAGNPCIGGYCPQSAHGFPRLIHT